MRRQSRVATAWRSRNTRLARCWRRVCRAGGRWTSNGVGAGTRLMMSSAATAAGPNSQPAQQPTAHVSVILRGVQHPCSVPVRSWQAGGCSRHASGAAALLRLRLVVAVITPPAAMRCSLPLLPSALQLQAGRLLLLVHQTGGAVPAPPGRRHGPVVAAAVAAAAAPGGAATGSRPSAEHHQCVSAAPPAKHSLLAKSHCELELARGWWALVRLVSLYVLKMCPGAACAPAAYSMHCSTLPPLCRPKWRTCPRQAACSLL